MLRDRIDEIWKNLAIEKIQNALNKAKKDAQFEKDVEASQDELIDLFFKLIAKKYNGRISSLEDISALLENLIKIEVTIDELLQSQEIK